MIACLLAWNLLWLHSDMHPRGKDVYDALLLAEATRLSLPLLQTVFAIAESKLPATKDLLRFRHEFEWVGFEPQDRATVEAWKQRLARALGSSLGETVVR